MISQNSIKTNKTSRGVYSLTAIVKIGLLSAIAFILMLLELPLPLFPAFLKMDLSDLPALIGGFALGPLAAILIEFIKNALHFIFKSETGGVGNLANFIVGISFTVPAAMIYMKGKNRKGAILGMFIGTLSMAIVAAIANYYILIPFYVKLYFGGDLDSILAIMAQANKNITDIKTYIMYAVIPFNIVKALITSVIAFLVYKKVSGILHK